MTVELKGKKPYVSMGDMAGNERLGAYHPDTSQIVGEA